MVQTQLETPKTQSAAMQQYYRFQSKIYDLTRWTFLFGRSSILKHIPYNRIDPFTLLEIGCGTGHNLQKIAATFPNAQLIGMDVSDDMISLAGKKLQRFGNRIRLQNRPYELRDESKEGKMDIILFSYSLTMINPQWQELLQRAYLDLKPGGLILVVDFHDSQFPWFKKHMSNHHVRMDSHLLPVLNEFKPGFKKVKKAYGGVWEYVMFVGAR
jgi:S-adenosylmethionine-diacylgycerolhomoserine-N-methlytransferase